MGQKTLVHLHNGMLLSRKQEWATTICDRMHGSGDHYAKWNNPGSEDKYIWSHR